MKPVALALAACVALAGLSPRLWADELAKPSKTDPAKEYAAIQKDWTAAQQVFFKAYQEAKTDAERQQILKEKRPKPAEYSERCLKLAKEHPDSRQALQALAWVVGNDRGSAAAKKALTQLKEKLTATDDLDRLQRNLAGLPAYMLGDLAPHVAALARKHLDHPQAVPLLVWVCSSTVYGPTPELAKLYNDTVDLLMERYPERKELAPLADWLAIDTAPAWAAKHLRRLIDKSPDAEVKAKALFGLASALAKSDESSQAEAEKRFQRYIDEYGKVPEKSQLVARARHELEEMKVRGLGKPAPEIAGDDLDGKSFKLSDYRGKVVLLDFWGFW